MVVQNLLAVRHTRWGKVAKASTGYAAGSMARGAAFRHSVYPPGRECPKKEWEMGCCCNILNMAAWVMFKNI
jgi:hypothetical protein